MITTVRKMGNSQGVLIPKPFLTQIGIEVGEVEIAIENNTIVIRKLTVNPREGWAESSKLIAAAGDYKLVIPEFGNDADKDLVW